MTDNKRGPWSKREKAFIADNAANMDYREIAASLQRNAKAVAKYIQENHADSFTEKAKTAEYDIRQSPVWNDIAGQFTPDEQRMFLYHWGRIISQFQDDVYPTEEIQIIDTIKLELLMNRAVTQQRTVIQDIEAMEVLLVHERGQVEIDVAAITNLERQIGVLRAALDSLNKDYKEMLDKKNKILKDMKATRDARIQHLESNKHNFLRFIRRIVEDAAFRRRIGRDMEKMRLAAQVEYERLSDWHQFQDGEVDQPWLTPDNVKDD